MRYKSTNVLSFNNNGCACQELLKWDFQQLPIRGNVYTWAACNLKNTM